MRNRVAAVLATLVVVSSMAASRPTAVSAQAAAASPLSYELVEHTTIKHDDCVPTLNGHAAIEGKGDNYEAYWVETATGTQVSGGVWICYWGGAKPAPPPPPPPPPTYVAIQDMAGAEIDAVPAPPAPPPGPSGGGTPGTPAVPGTYGVAMDINPGQETITGLRTWGWCYARGTQTHTVNVPAGIAVIPISVTITMSGVKWTLGDGTTKTSGGCGNSSESGAAYRHTYQKKASTAVGVTVTWTLTSSVGSLRTRTSSANLPLTVKEVRSVLK